MIKSVRKVMAADRKGLKVPRSSADLIPVKRIWNDGIFLTESGYSKTYRFSDINYLTAGGDNREKLFLGYCDLINSLDSSAVTKITVHRHRLNGQSFSDRAVIPYREDGLDRYREEYNRMILDKISGESGTVQDRYITVTVRKKDIESARSWFIRLGTELAVRFAGLGSQCEDLTAAERISMLHGYFRRKEAESFCPELSDVMKRGQDIRELISPEWTEPSTDMIEADGRYIRALYLKDYASYIDDRFVSELTGACEDMLLSVDVIPVSKDEAVRELENKLLGVETNITGWQRRQNTAGNWSAQVPYDMDQQRTATREFLKDLTERDQRMMFAVITMLISADSREQLERDTEAVLAAARGRRCQAAVLRFQQLDGMATALPVGVRRIDDMMVLTTESLAAFMPFRVQEIQEEHGIYFGENAISRNLIMCNKASLMNQSSFLLGVPGSGKSFCAKELIIFLLLGTDDDVIIADPEGEFVPLAEAMGDLASVIRIRAGGQDRINAMKMNRGYGDTDPVVIKSEFIMSLIEQMDPGSVTARHKSLIDRCVEKLYRESRRSGQTPTLAGLREVILTQKEDIAADIALGLELYTEGSLDIFGHGENVDMDRRCVVFDLHGLGSQLKPAGLLVVTDAILNRVSQNFWEGKRTHIFIDEFHTVLENEHSAEFFESAWMQFRKRNAYPTAITQNVEHIWNSPRANTMLSNSECIVMLNQAPADRQKLAELLGISDELLRHITNADEGCGLIRYGSALVPFRNSFPRDTELYSLMTTRPGEGEFGKGSAYQEVLDGWR